MFVLCYVLALSQYISLTVKQKNWSFFMVVHIASTV